MPLIILLTLSVIGTYLVFRDANARGMNARLWALLMLVTSMLALPVYLMLRKPKLQV